MPYTIEEHIHRYASWAASRAASVKPNRFKVEIGRKVLNSATMRNYIRNPDDLPDTADSFDLNHKMWREELIELARIEGVSFSHGIAAKLINIYMKSIIICGGYHEHTNSLNIHPPIDRLLLGELESKNFNSKKKFWKNAKTTSWSNFSSDQYQEVIDEIRLGCGGEPLWKIEEDWVGYQ